MEGIEENLAPDFVNSDAEINLANVHEDVLFKDFVFSQNKWKPNSRWEFEFGDNLIWIRDRLFLFEVKTRNKAIEEFVSDEIESSWVDDSIECASKQIEDDLKRLRKYAEIPLKNAHGVKKILRGEMINAIEKLIIFRPHPKYGNRNPFKKKYTVSLEAGFIHCFSIFEYAYICLLLGTPFEILNYLQHRQQLLEEYSLIATDLTESALLGHYITKETKGHLTKRPPCSEDAQIIWHIKTDITQLNALRLFRNWSVAVLREGTELDKQGCLTVLEAVAWLPRGGILELSDRFDEAIALSNADYFNHSQRQGWYWHAGFTHIATGTSFSFVSVKETDRHRLQQINDTASRSEMSCNGNNPNFCTNHIGIALNRERGDVRSTWTLLTYPADLSEASPEMIDAIRRRTSERVLTRHAPFDFKNTSS